MQVKVTITYEYEGGETTPEAAKQAELQDWLEGNVTVQDVLAADDKSAIDVIVS